MKTIINPQAPKEVALQNDETIEVKLRRLAATFEGRFNPITPTQQYWYSLKSNPYDHKDPGVAFVEFATLCKQWNQTSRVGNALSSIVTKSDVTLTPLQVEVLDPKAAGIPMAPIDESKPEVVQEKTKKLRIIGGDIQDCLSKDCQMARDVSNILTIYTTCVAKQVGNTTKHIINSLDSAKCGNSYIFDIRLEDVRSFWPKEGDSNVETRNAMYRELTTDLTSQHPQEVLKARSLIYCLMDKIARNSVYKVEMPAEFVRVYNENKPDPLCETRSKMFMFGFSLYKKVQSADHDDIWKKFLRIRQGLGGSKSTILSGYSIIDTLPGLATKYEEALDIVNCYHACGFSGVRLLQADTVLSEILVATGIPVICSSQGRGVATGTPGKYAQAGKLKVMNWQTIRQQSPEIKGNVLNFPAPEPLYESNTFSYEYVPASFEKDYFYLPSLHSADGYCIKTNVKPNYSISAPELISRFCLAIFTRCQYMYTRVTFSQVDPCRGYFIYGIVLKSQRDKKLESDGGLEALMAADKSTLFKESDKVEWDSNGTVVPSYLKNTQVSVIVLDAPVAGTRITRSELHNSLRQAAKNVSPSSRRQMFYDYAVTNSTKDPAFNLVISSLYKVDVIGILVEEWGYSKKVTYNGVGDVTFTNKKYWSSVIKVLPAEPPITISSSPPPIDPASSPAPVDFYANLPTATITFKE